MKTVTYRQSIPVILLLTALLFPVTIRAQSDSSPGTAITPSSSAGQSSTYTSPAGSDSTAVGPGVKEPLPPAEGVPEPDRDPVTGRPIPATNTGPCSTSTAVRYDGTPCASRPGSPATGQTGSNNGMSFGDSVRKVWTAIASTTSAGTNVVDSIRKAADSVPILKTVATAINYGQKVFGQMVASILNNSDSGSNSYADFVRLRSNWTPSASTTDSGVRATSSAPGLPATYDGHPDSVPRGTTSVSKTANVTNTIAFEIKVLKADKSLFADWRAATGTISVPAGANIYLRWSANEYAQCLPFFGDSGRYALTATNQTMRTGNTETSGYELVASNTTYRIECGGQVNGEAGVDQRAISITVTGNPGSPTSGISDGNGQTVCTMDAKMCPDGSYVGRSGPSCEFAACPTTTYDSGTSL